MASNHPHARMKDKFGEKAKIVAELEKLTKDDLWVARTNKDKGLAHVSNAKLLRLHATFSEVKEKFGTREKLIASILDLDKRAKDEGYKASLSKFPVPRLYDLYKSVAKRHGAATKAETKAEAKPAKKAEKPAAKAEAKPAKKAAAKKA